MFDGMFGGMFGGIFDAGLEDLEECPFCSFAVIMTTSAELNKVLQCQNPQCRLT